MRADRPDTRSINRKQKKIMALQKLGPDRFLLARVFRI